MGTVWAGKWGAELRQPLVPRWGGAGTGKANALYYKIFGEGIKTILIYQQPWGSILLFDYNFENIRIGMKFAFIQFILKDGSNMEGTTFKHDSRVRNVIQ